MSSKSSTTKKSHFIQKTDVYEAILPRLAEALCAGDAAALYEAVIFIESFCRVSKDEYRVPDWVWDNLVAAYENSIRRRVPVGKGRLGNTAKRHESNRIHFTRHLHVKRFVEGGATVHSAREQAHSVLKGDPAQGSPEAMERSYYMVKKSLSDPAKRLRFRTPSLDTDELLSGH